MDYYKIYNELKNEKAKEVGKPVSELIAWRDYDPIELDYLTLDHLERAKREITD